MIPQNKDFNGDIIVDLNGLLLGKMIIVSLPDRVKTLIKDNELFCIHDQVNEDFLWMSLWRLYLIIYRYNKPIYIV